MQPTHDLGCKQPFAAKTRNSAYPLGNVDRDARAAVAQEYLELLRGLPAAMKQADRAVLLVAQILEDACRGEVLVSQEELGSLIGCSGRTAQRATRRLAAGGDLAVGEHYTDYGHRTANSYASLHRAPDNEVEATPPDKMSGGGPKMAEQQKEPQKEEVVPPAEPVDNAADVQLGVVELAAVFSSSNDQKKDRALPPLEGPLAAVLARWGPGALEDVLDAMSAREARRSPQAAEVALELLLAAKKVDVPGAYFRALLARAAAGKLGLRGAKPAKAQGDPLEQRRRDLIALRDGLRGDQHSRRAQLDAEIFTISRQLVARLAV